MSSDRKDLRTRTEKKLASDEQRPLPESREAIAETLQELEVHQVELEMQNQELQRAEAELAQAHDHFRELFELAPVPYLVLDPDATIRAANFAAEALLPERAQLIGSLLPSYLLAEESYRFHSWWQDARQSLTRSSLEVGLRGSGGQPRWTRLLCAAAPASGKARIHLALVDLTEVRKARAQLEDLIDAAPIAMFLADRDHCIRRCNDTLAALFGYSRDELVGKSVDDLVPAALRAGHAGYRESFDRRDSARPMGRGQEIVALHRDGTRFPIEVSFSPLETSAGEAILAAVVDLSERRRFEEEIRQAQKMEALGTLAGGIAHDFNNLVMGQSGCANVALSLLAPDHPARMYLSEIVKSANTGAAITRRLLDFARHVDETWEPFDLHEALRASRPLVERLLGEDVSVVWELRSSCPQVRLRPGELEQILLNLASNGRDAMPRGGRMTIATDDYRVETPDTSLAAGDYVRLQVTDNGTGMTPETMRRAFDPLFTTKEMGRGTGLGLSTVYSIVHQAGGRITVDSRPGSGTTFSLLLPVLSRSPRSSPPRRAETPQPQAPLTVLLVEDDAAVRMASRFYLEQLGHRVLNAADGDEAVECVENFQDEIDVMLCDVVMPGTSGRELLRRVRAVRPDLRVVLMSAHSEARLVADDRIDLGQEFLQKPFDRDRLDDALRGR